MFRPLSGLWSIFSPSSPLFSDLDINLSPFGNIIKSAGETLDLTLQIDASETTKVSWTKVGAFIKKNWNQGRQVSYSQGWYYFIFIQDNVKLDKEPKFAKVTYSDSGRYECDVTMGLLSRKASFELVVEGKYFRDTQKLFFLLFFNLFTLLLRITWEDQYQSCVGTANMELQRAAGRLCLA